MSTAVKVRLRMIFRNLLELSSATSATSNRLAKLSCFARRRSWSSSADTATHLTPNARSATRRPPRPDQRSSTNTRPGTGTAHANCGRSAAPRQARGLAAQSISASWSCCWVVSGGEGAGGVTVGYGTAGDGEEGDLPVAAEEEHHEDADDPVAAEEDHHEDADGLVAVGGVDEVHPEEVEHEVAQGTGSVGQAHHAEEALEVEDDHEAVDGVHGKTARPRARIWVEVGVSW